MIQNGDIFLLVGIGVCLINQSHQQRTSSDMTLSTRENVLSERILEVKVLSQSMS